MHEPVPVGALFESLTNKVFVTFDERIAFESLRLGQLVLRNVAFTPRHNFPGGTVVGRRVSWPTEAILGDNAPPPRVTYTAALGDIVGVGGGLVQPFADFPVTVV